ncbi:unnamed protein product [Dibothriocephalus latus]|uniref:KATNIP domain-containing protein n=1 Tax=Dibothriocephalus latus TaxID=60516 RepID=A0A3P7M452_DIBLA|nr:unnamed protein product [Dibothriocephalus latus]
MSWGSLELFNRLQAGRLDVTADNEGDEDFSIPELPVGRELLLDILSTWGDPHYVGLTSIQVFTADGLEISRSCSISAYPPDINILPQFSSDPRVATNLLDGVNETQDQTHMGVRDINIFLDRKCIFRGQISRSSGLERGKPQEFGETILFTTDEAVLQRIAQHDPAFLRDIEEEEEEEEETEEGEEPNQMVVGERLGEGEPAATEAQGVKTRWLDLRLLTAWDGGECGYIGLAGIKLLADPGGKKEARVWLTHQVDSPACNFRVDSHALTDGINHTTDEDHMWTAKFTEDVGLQLRFWLIPPNGGLEDKEEEEEEEENDIPTLYGIRLWNYNVPKQWKCASGVKFFQILDDRGRCLGNLFGQEGPFLLRPGPGHLKYDFSQWFLLADIGGTTWNYSPASTFVLEISLHSNWGDEERIGLSGLQLLGCKNETIVIRPEQVFLHPGVAIVIESAL